MGYQREKTKTVYKILHGKEMPSLQRPDLFAFHFLADNNVSPIEYYPSFLAYGFEYSIIGEACTLAADAESGMLKPNNQWIRAEEYIAQWRRAIKRARNFESFLGTYAKRDLIVTAEQEKLQQLLETETDDSNGEWLQENYTKYKSREKQFWGT